MKDIIVIVMWDEDDGTLRIEVDEKHQGREYSDTVKVFSVDTITVENSDSHISVINDTENDSIPSFSPESD